MFVLLTIIFMMLINKWKAIQYRALLHWNSSLLVCCYLELCISYLIIYCRYYTYLTGINSVFCCSSLRTLSHSHCNRCFVHVLGDGTSVILGSLVINRSIGFFLCLFLLTFQWYLCLLMNLIHVIISRR